MFNETRRQYEKFPYPPVSVLALPRRDQGQSLAYEYGSSLISGLASGKEKSHRGIRILVAGCGTFEPLVVAQMHPDAKEIVAVDLSQNSLDQVQKRIRLAQVLRFPLRIPPVRLICGDLREIQFSEPFDYVLASNVLHHVPEPARLLHRLSSFLRLDGFFRIVTYPYASRIWMRKAARFFVSQGLTSNTPDLKKKAHLAIRSLSKEDPIRLCFESHLEVQHTAGLVDAFFHSCENPLRPLEWKEATHAAGLSCIGEAQSEDSRSSFLDFLLPELKSLDFWVKLQILDDLLELCSNPILWFQKKSSPDSKIPELAARQNVNLTQELKQGLDRIQSFLPSEVSLESLWFRLKMEVGPRVHPKNHNQTLPGLAITDYPLKDLMTC